MPFEDGTADAFVMLDVLHHVPTPAEFCQEASRCLRPGGRIVMIEPANTVFAPAQVDRNVLYHCRRERSVTYATATG
jgi:SAM-dependent methyltransferase